MRRKPRQAFMGGAFVFPGGRLDAADMDPALSPFLGGFSAATARPLLQEPDLAEETALGLFLAAIRETFEEAGVLFARDQKGMPLSAEQAQALAGCRSELHEGNRTPAEMARREGLCFAPDLLVPYAHWITPEAEPRRFDTRFFLAALPPGQMASHDRQELCESRWLSPVAALAEQAAGKIALMPPTLKTMEELSTFATLPDLFAEARAQRIRTILPEIFQTREEVGIRLPTDAEYTGARLPASRPGETTRVVKEKEGEFWRPQSVIGLRA